MRNYQRNKSSKYYVPHNIYMQIQYKIKDYDRLKRDRVNAYGDAEQKVKLSYIENELKAIDQACIEIRGIYSDRTQEDFDPIKAYWSYDYFNYIFKRKSDDDEGPSYRTWNRYKINLSKAIANNLKIF